MQRRGLGRAGRWLLAGAVVLAVVIAGTFTWRELNRPEDAVRATALAIADGLAQGRIDRTLLSNATDADQEELRSLLLGMGKLRPKVSVGAVAVEDGDRRAGVRLAFDWTIHEGKPHWTYDSFLTLHRTDQGWRGVWDRTLLQPEVRSGQRLRAVRLAAPRGEVIGARGERLFWNAEANRLGIDKTKLTPDEAPAAARRLARLLDLDPERFATRVQRAGSKAFVEAVVLRNEGDDFDLTREALRIRGVHTVPIIRSLPIRKGFAEPVLGRVGDATAEIIAASSSTIRDGDPVGLSGLQASRNSTLMGVTGFRVLVYQADNPTVERELFRVEPKEGRSITVTLDARLQSRAERVLAGVGPAAALIAIRPSTGEILAAANGPGADGYSIATRGRYPPGSVFKTVTVLAALRAGVKPSDPVRCTPSITVNGKRFDNWQGYPASALGRVSLRTAFAHSCNTAMIRLASKVTPGALARAAADLGLGEGVELGVSSFLGEVPEPTDEVSAAAQLIGQDGVLVSPLGAAAVAASIGAGHPVRPYLLADSPPAAVAGVTAAEAKQLQTLMAAVTQQGSGRVLAGLPGASVLSKTGTASYGQPVRFHAWMIAIKGDLAVAAFVADGTSGAITAGPLLRRFLSGPS